MVRASNLQHHHRQQQQHSIAQQQSLKWKMKTEYIGGYQHVKVDCRDVSCSGGRGEKLLARDSDLHAVVVIVVVIQPAPYPRFCFMGNFFPSAFDYYFKL